MGSAATMVMIGLHHECLIKVASKRYDGYGALPLETIAAPYQAPILVLTRAGRRDVKFVGSRRLRDGICLSVPMIFQWKLTSSVSGMP